MSDFLEFAATLLMTAAAIWLPGVVVIKVSERLRGQPADADAASSADSGQAVR